MAESEENPRKVVFYLGVIAMLVEFRVKNFRSFRDEQVLSLVASRDTTLSENCIEAGPLKLLKAVAVYGANASGKSNLIKALDRMRGIVLNSAAYKPTEELGITPFLLDSSSTQKPSMFEVTFFCNEVRYQYGFEANNKRIEEEWLIAYPRRGAQKWFERVFNSKTAQYHWKYSTFLKGEKAKLAEMTRENALFLSVAAQWNHQQLGVIYNWFKDNLRVVDSKHSLRPVTAKMLLGPGENDKMRPLSLAVISLLKEADLGIAGVSVKQREVDLSTVRFPEDMPDEVRSEFLKQLEDQFLDVQVSHRTVSGGKDIHLSLDDESDGTQEFFKLIGPWMQACAFGITVFIDELEASLHPLLTRALVEMIQNPEVNGSGAQFVFTSHDTTLQDQELLRRDQIWFTEKGKDGGTRLCPLSDYQPRKDEAIQKGYLSGRYGAVPVLERFTLE